MWARWRRYKTLVEPYSHPVRYHQELANSCDHWQTPGRASETSAAEGMAAGTRPRWTSIIGSHSAHDRQKVMMKKMMILDLTRRRDTAGISDGTTVLTRRERENRWLRAASTRKAVGCSTWLGGRLRRTCNLPTFQAEKKSSNTSCWSVNPQPSTTCPCSLRRMMCAPRRSTLRPLRSPFRCQVVTT